MESVAQRLMEMGLSRGALAVRRRHELMLVLGDTTPITPLGGGGLFAEAFLA